jgi:hypothetical protein
VRRERVKLRIMFGSAVFAWLMVGHCMWTVIDTDSRRSMMWLLVALTIASSLTAAGVVLASLKRVADAVYELGHEHGRQSAGCAMYRPQLSLVSNGAAKVVALRPVE